MRRFPIRLASIGLALALAHPASARVTEAWRTVAESSGFRATASYDETLDYVRRLADASPAIEVRPFGSSAIGRPLVVVVAAGGGELTPAAAVASGKPIVLVQNGIHGGEIDGKDASLMLLRSLALGEEPRILERVILLVVPVYNVDGHERVSPNNRPNQNGPVEGMGFRTTADGHDLNRDHLKLETPEARAIVGLFNAWRPHLHVDNHVTDGSDHDWVLTYAWAERPQSPPPVADWLDAHMPRVIEATRAAGPRIGPFVSLLERSDPSAGFDSVVAEPRYATGYYPLRNRPSLLVENHSYKSYRERVLANRDFMLALLREIAREPASLVDAVRDAERLAVARGKPDAEPSEVTLRYARARPDRIRFPVYDWSLRPSTVMGTPLVRYERGEVREIEVPWVHRLEPDLRVRRPRGYLLLPGWPAIERRLRDHGLRSHALAHEIEIEVETLRVERAEAGERRGGTYQGLTRVEVEVERARAVRRLPAGTLWVPADQPDFEIAAQLFEPEAPDSLIGWGLLSSVFERKEYIEPAVLERVALELLADPALADEWRRALEDESFAASPRARWMWWYRRTRYWDETVGLLPVFRVLDVPDLPLGP